MLKKEIEIDLQVNHAVAWQNGQLKMIVHSPFIKSGPVIYTVEDLLNNLNEIYDDKDELRELLLEMYVNLNKEINNE